MLPDMVSLQDYQGVEGFFGAQSGQDVEALNKALAAGSAINAPTPFTAGDGFALRVESLEATLKVTTFKMEHLKLWRQLPKQPEYNTVSEFNRLDAYGQNLDAGFIAEGDLPTEEDSLFTRQYALVKFLGTTRRVTHPMTLVKAAHGPAIAQETVNGTMHLLRLLERGLFYANSQLSALQFDGFERLITANSPAANTVDLRGLPLSEDMLTDASLIVSDAPNYGTPTHLHINPKVKADLVKTFFPKERHSTFAGQGAMVGLDVKGFTSPAGDVQFESNPFITDGGAPTAVAIGDVTRRPATPVVTLGAATPADPLSMFTADDAGAYWVFAVACNRFGRSVAVDVGGGFAIAGVVAGDAITFGLTPGSAVAVEWYEIYRTRVGAAANTARLCLRVPNAAGAGQQAIVDRNVFIPGCTLGFLFQQNLECMSFKQLAPMVKIPLATIDSSIRWMQLLYGVPVLYTPGKVLMFRNIGRAAGSPPSP